MSSSPDHLDFEPDSERCLSSGRLTAVKTGIAGCTVLLSVGEASDYKRNIAAYIDTYKPVGLRECELVQTLSDTMWRLQRTHRLEMAIFAQGAAEFEGAFDDQHAALRPQMIELQTFMKYEKQLRNLQLQEARLQRRYEKDSAELRNLQKERAKKDEAGSSQPKTQKIAVSAPAAASQTAPNPGNGFVFSTVAPRQPASDLSYVAPASELHVE